VDSLAWGKLVVNAAINPLTALLGINNGELIKRSTARDLCAALATEVAAVAGKKNISLPFAYPVKAVEDVIESTAGNQSSMLQDVLRGAPTEIDAISGATISSRAVADMLTRSTATVIPLLEKNLTTLQQGDTNDR